MFIMQVTFSINKKLIIPQFYFRCNFHKKCAFAPRNNCAKNDSIAPSTFLTSNEILPSSSSNIGIKLNEKIINL